jgi:glutamate-ammonia-ligase adenylyltransferase
MSSSLEAKLEAALGESPLRARLPASAAPLVERRSGDACVAALDGAPLVGLARAVAASGEFARFLALRPALFERIAALRGDSLAARSVELESVSLPDPIDDREAFFDALRLLRRDEMLFAACAHFGGLAEFPAVSDFLSRLAEICAQQALVAADERVRSEGVSPLAVLGMGKLAGREFTYHSDLDVIFLFRDEQPDSLPPTRVAQRWIAALVTATAAGYVYHVDSRLRPSGQQGALVTTHESFARYQTEQAATWEHVALLRARAVAGDSERAQRELERTRAKILQNAPNPWRYLADMRGRVVAERGKEDAQRAALKAGRGGIMDVEFLASGALLERRVQLVQPALPAVPAMLRAACSSPRLEALLADYALLRRVEAAARWLAGRAVETLTLAGEPAVALAELVIPGAPREELPGQLAAARARIANAFERVAAKGSIDALDG